MDDEPVMIHVGPRSLRVLTDELHAARDGVFFDAALDEAGTARLAVVRLANGRTHVFDLATVGPYSEPIAALHGVSVTTLAVPTLDGLPSDRDGLVVAGTVLAGLFEGRPTLEEVVRLLELPATPTGRMPVHPKAEHIHAAVAASRNKWRVLNHLEHEVDRLELRETVELDLAANVALRAVEAAGISIDVRAWEEHCGVEEATANELHRKLVDVFGPIDLQDQSAVAEALKRRGSIDASARTSELASFAGRRVVRHLLEWRSKIAFIRDGVPNVGKAIERASDRRVRATWHIHGTATGRMTTSGPNLLGLPRTARINFRAPPGRVFIYADFSASQLRILAQVTGDAELQRVFAEGGDPHELLAQKLSRPGQAVSREKAKPINFGAPFGMGAQRLAAYARSDFDVELSVPDAKRFLADYLEAHRGVHEWQAEMRLQLPQQLRSLGGRLRRWQGDDNLGSRLASQIQMTEADAIKRALVSMHQELPLHDAQVVLVIYDGVLVEAPRATAEAVRDIVASHMRDGLAHYLRNVPVEVHVDIRSTWGGKP